jgi:hypothetical protein
MPIADADRGHDPEGPRGAAVVPVAMTGRSAGSGYQRLSAARCIRLSARLEDAGLPGWACRAIITVPRYRCP